MRRREFISGGTAIVPLFKSLAAYSQPARKIPVVGYLWHAGNAELSALIPDRLRRPSFVSIERTESRPSLWRRWGAFFAQTATIFDGNTARIVTKKNPKLGTRSGLFAVCCLT
jgi:hypothetical protein